MATTEAAQADYERFTIDVKIYKVTLQTAEPKDFKIKCTRNGKDYITNVL